MFRHSREIEDGNVSNSSLFKKRITTNKSKWFRRNNYKNKNKHKASTSLLLKWTIISAFRCYIIISSKLCGCITMIDVLRKFNIIFLAFDLSVLRGLSICLSPPQRPMTSDFEGISIPDFIHYIYVPFLFREKEPVFPFSMLSAKQGNYWYHFYNIFGVTLSLTGDWTRDLPHSMPALNH